MPVLPQASRPRNPSTGLGNYNSFPSLDALSPRPILPEIKTRLPISDKKYGEDELKVAKLPSHIQSYLDKLGLEAYYVPGDGNCLYRAVTFGPEWSPHQLARQMTAAYLNGIKQVGNDLACTVTDDQVEKIREGIAFQFAK